MIEQTLRRNTGKQLSETVHCLPHIQFMSRFVWFCFTIFQGWPWMTTLYFMRTWILNYSLEFEPQNPYLVPV